MWRLHRHSFSIRFVVFPYSNPLNVCTGVCTGNRCPWKNNTIDHVDGSTSFLLATLRTFPVRRISIGILSSEAPTTLVPFCQTVLCFERHHRRFAFTKSHGIGAVKGTKSFFEKIFLKNKINFTRYKRPLKASRFEQRPIFTKREERGKKKKREN